MEFKNKIKMDLDIRLYFYFFNKFGWVGTSNVFAIVGCPSTSLWILRKGLSRKHHDITFPFKKYDWKEGR
jgi:hypothetical protein